MFDLALVNLIYCPRFDQFRLDRVFQAYKEVGLRYRVWTPSLTRFSTYSYNYIEDVDGISQRGDWNDLDLVVWCLPEHIFDLDFCLQKHLRYIRSIFAGPIVFIINPPKFCDLPELPYNSCYLQDHFLTWAGATYSLQAGYSEKSEWELIFFRDWKLKSILE